MPCWLEPLGQHCIEFFMCNVVWSLLSSIALTGLIEFWLDSCICWKWPFFGKKRHTEWKKSHNSVKTFDVLIKLNGLENLSDKCISVFFFYFGCRLCKLLFWASWVQRYKFLEAYYFFFRTTGLRLKLLILIESPDIFNWKLSKKVKVGIIIGTIKFGPN